MLFDLPDSHPHVQTMMPPPITTKSSGVHPLFQSTKHSQTDVHSPFQLAKPPQTLPKPSEDKSDPKPPEEPQLIGIGVRQDFQTLLRLLGEEYSRLLADYDKLRRQLANPLCQEETLMVAKAKLKDVRFDASLGSLPVSASDALAVDNPGAPAELADQPLLEPKSPQSMGPVSPFSLKYAEPLFGPTEQLLRVKVLSATGLRRADWMPGRTSDPYCILRLEGKNESPQMRTRVIEKTLNPVWDHDFVITNYLPGNSLVFEVYDKDWGPSSDNLLGIATLTSSDLETDFRDDSLLLSHTGGATSHLNVVIWTQPVEAIDESFVTMLPCWHVKQLESQPTRSLSEVIALDQRISAARESVLSALEAPPPESRIASIARHMMQPVDPTSPARLVWDVLGILVLLAELFWIPMQVFNPPETTGVQTLGLLTLLYWSLDVFASFNTSVYGAKGKLVRRRSVIACQYCKGWLFFDLLLIGIDWVKILMVGDRDNGVGAARAAKLARLVRLARLLRLMRLAKIRNLLFKLETFINSEAAMVYFAVGRNLFTILILNHLVACAWYFVGDRDQGWVRTNGYRYAKFGERYVLSLQWSISQFTPGAPPLHAEALVERVFHTAVLSLAIVVSTVFVSSITSAMGAAWSAKRYTSAQTFLLRKYLSQNNISMGLAARITRYVGCVLELRNKKIPVGQVYYISLLSTPLHNQLQTEISLPFLIGHSFFKNYRKMNRRSFDLLCNSLGTLSFAQNDDVFSPATRAVHMNFISHGNSIYHCLLRGPYYNVNTLLSEKQWCCEGALWVEWQHLGELKATMEVTIITLLADRFFENVSSNTCCLEFARSRAEEFLKEAKSLEVFKLGPTDLPLDLLTGRGALDNNETVKTPTLEVAKAGLNELSSWPVEDAREKPAAPLRKTL